MNVSMAVAWNPGWKLASVLRGRANPELLHTYSEERHAVAQELIDFDREFSRKVHRSASRMPPNPEQFQRYFTAPSTFQHLAAGFPIGRGPGSFASSWPRPLRTTGVRRR
jgi:phenol 2-monooxygenase (NADPH)